MSHILVLDIFNEQHSMIQLTHDEIDYTALTESVRSDQAGAVVLFLGTVREMTNGRQTTALDYDAYPEMESLVPNLLVAVGNEYADDETTLDASKEIACFPPVSGG